ncbi:methyltransferase, TIGR04290 family protein [Gemmatimonadetes bacterium T265]|nr:methyltransferase, TIGR04290 family protein [Gemmatimonadetes bacterium T265]
MTSLLQQHASAATAEREAEILALGPWFHNLHLPDGAQTAPGSPLGDFPRFKWLELAPHLPADLAGWTALDVGCNAGFYAFELARRGARVTGIDVEPLFLRQAEWAAREFGLADRVAFRRMAVYDLPRLGERFDLVLFMGVLYHLRYPMLGLDLVTETVGRLMVFQTLTTPGMDVHPDTARDRDVLERDDFAAPGWPKLSFIEHRFAGDETNWWAPNHAGVEAMLRASGMRVTVRPGHEIYFCEPDPDADPWPRGRGRAELLSATGRPWQDAADRRDRGE